MHLTDQGIQVNTNKMVINHIISLHCLDIKKTMNVQWIHMSSHGHDDNLVQNLWCFHECDAVNENAVVMTTVAYKRFMFLHKLGFCK